MKYHALFVISVFLFRKKGILISYQRLSVVCQSVWVRLSVTFLVNVSPPELLEVATSNFVAEYVTCCRGYWATFCVTLTLG